MLGYMLGCLVIGEKNAFTIKTDKAKTISELRDDIKIYKKNVFKTFDANQLTLWKSWDDFDTIEEHFGTNLTAKYIHIIIQMPMAPSATTKATVETLSIPMKRQAEPQDYDSNHKPVNPHEREFWNELHKAQIVLKFPDNADKNRYTSEQLSKYMKVEENEIVLNDNVMLNSQNKLIFCDGSPVMESEVVKIDFVKFLRFHKSPNGIVNDIDSQDILIKKSYLQMIEKIELDRADGTNGCVIIGSPGIGKTHFSLYLAFYITRRYNSDDIIYEQKLREKSRLLYIQPNYGAVSMIVHPEFEFPVRDFFYIVDSAIPAPWNAKYTFLITPPKCDLWHNFEKNHPRKYYIPIWSEEEILDVWNLKHKDKISEIRVKKLIKKWGCIPQRIFYLLSSHSITT
ncbi:crinkler (CRN) family protein, putative [Rhizophagus irregularis DAOM 181602=DAOM 197198]|nr:crinkler (CRN) family protein, putative [Rhizophagus irregularis DAOM 181602=DAOM 197198]